MFEFLGKWFNTTTKKVLAGLVCASVVAVSIWGGYKWYHKDKEGVVKSNSGNSSSGADNHPE